MAGNYDGWYDKWYPKMGNFEVPHYSKYKDIDGIWQLEYTRDKLAKYGLKDPWMRYFFSLLNVEYFCDNEYKSCFIAFKQTFIV